MTPRMYSKLSAASLEGAAPPLASLSGVEASETTLSLSRPMTEPLGVELVP